MTPKEMSKDYTHTIIMFYFSKNKTLTESYLSESDPDYGKKIPDYMTPEFLQAQEEVRLTKKFIEGNEGTPIIIPIDLNNEGLDFLQMRGFLKEEFEVNADYMSDIIVSLILDSKYKDTVLKHNHLLEWNIFGHGSSKPGKPFITDDKPNVIGVDDKPKTNVTYYALSVIMKKVTEKLEAQMKENLFTTINIKACNSSLKKGVEPDSEIIAPTIDYMGDDGLKTRAIANYHNATEVVKVRENLKQKWKNASWKEKPS